jgi:hypothetical protein
MTRLLTAILILAITSIALGSDKLDKETNAIVAEGKSLYRSEMASWYGTDIFLDKFKEKRENFDGYFSYSDNNLSTCLFYSKDENAKVLCTITFDETYALKNAVVDGNEREFTADEKEIYTIRQKALEEINNDTLFKTYKNSNLNLIPLIANGEKKVFVLSGPKENGVIIFGNDYLLTFDKNNNLKSKKMIHNNIIPMDFGKADSLKAKSGIHSHLPSTGEFITSTDICTLMLYEKLAEFEQYYVVSEKYISIWNCKSDELTVITKKVWDKINEDQKKRHPIK